MFTDKKNRPIIILQSTNYDYLYKYGSELQNSKLKSH